MVLPSDRLNSRKHFLEVAQGVRLQARQRLLALESEVPILTELGKQAVGSLVVWVLREGTFVDDPIGVDAIGLVNFEPEIRFDQNDAIEDVALNDLGLDVYPNQIEIISSEQMLDAYSSLGMPLMYQHWSFGKRFAYEEKLYRKGVTGLAYEIVINSNPCISYNLEENSMAMQTLVMAHAAFGHNHFFKNNYLFRQWSDAEGILDYMQHSSSNIAKYADRYGTSAVEEVLDAAHALMDHSVFRYRRPVEITRKEEKRRERRRVKHETEDFRDIWLTLPQDKDEKRESSPAKEEVERRSALKLPQENLLHFIAEHSPVLEHWQRNILHIVRDTAQYFYPQTQTKVMNEGCATFVHHYIVNALFERGLLSEGAMLEILRSHANVIFQPDFDHPRYSGINPYALGFGMMKDIQRICVTPTQEDYDWFPDLAGTKDWRSVLKDAWSNYRDESFVRQYLSPRMIRKLKLFEIMDDASDDHLTVAAIHDEPGYRKVRAALAESYDPSCADPDIQIVDVNLKGDRVLHLEHRMRNGVPLAEDARDEVLKHIRRLWGYDVRFVGVDGESGNELYVSSTAE